MKKKRFLKLVMSYGIQRDKAARMAARVGEFGSYEALFSFLRPSLAFWQMGAAARRLAGRSGRPPALLTICSPQWGQPLPPAFPLLCAGMLTTRRSGNRNKRIFRRREMCSCRQRIKS